jgi:hypothetical protein
MKISVRSAVLAGLAATGLVFASAGTSQASTTGRCYSGMACYYYNSNHAGAVGVVGTGAIYNLEDLIFAAGTGSGSGQYIKNNAASAENDHSSYYFFSFYNSGWQGSYDIIPPNSWANLNATYNENASTCINSSASRPSTTLCQEEVVD